MSKTANPQPTATRQQIGNWLHSFLPDVSASFKVEQLGKGVVYCRILNHYFPGIILINRIIWNPKSQYQNILNLKVAQNALVQLKINIAIDPIRLSKEKFNENWAFICALHKYLNPNCQETLAPAQEKLAYNYYSQMMAQNPSMIFTSKRTNQQFYPDSFFQGLGRSQFYPIDQNSQQSGYYNASKYSVGKLQGMNAQMGNSSPNKGKWSVNSHMFQNNLTPIIDRIKQILLKPFNNTEKIRQIKILLNIPLNQEVVVKVEQDDDNQIIVTHSKIAGIKGHEESRNKEGNQLSSETGIQTKQEITLLQPDQ